MRRSEKCLLAGAVGLIAIGVVDVRAATLRAVIHIHSRYSHTGTESIDEIAKKAAEKGIDVFIPTDTFVAEWDYGLWPLRGLVHETVSRTSVVSVGADRYLERIREIRERYPGLIVIPGVEVAPYYRWEGRPWTRLTLTDWHRHMLVIGLEKPEDYEGLPALGNPSSYPWDPRALLVPAALFASALLLLLRGFRKTSAWAALIGCVFFIDGWPFRSPSQSPYLAKTPWTPYQRVIDYARGKGGLVFWAHPDAPNWKDPTAVGGPVDLRTKPYPDALLETANYDGFGIFQEGNRVTALPGGAWDEELGLFCDGRRKRPSWGIGELDYRSPETNFDIDSTEMILDAKGRSPAAVLESLRAGRFYVILPSPRTTGRLVLDAWDLKSANASAGQGGTLRGTRSPVIELEVSRSDGASRPADVEIIRGGSVILKETATLPHKWSFQDAGNRADRTYYRARLRDADGGELYTNPIFSFSKP